jgi:hypothetical protein
MLPQRIDSDNESAFLSGENGGNDAVTFQGLLRRWDIELHTNEIGDHRKLAFVDRVTRTLRSLFNKARVIYGNAWLPHLDELVAMHNEKVQSATGISPASTVERDLIDPDGDYEPGAQFWDMADAVGRLRERKMSAATRCRRRNEQ